ncbi:MAG TPA: 7-carboxy-7-deazaguanine synthase QueE [Nitrosopumilaceae archaeon]|nr:7-carboxy-7-deazaguanine synthase QueE [Nitrosopumilaceae archaeon]
MKVRLFEIFTSIEGEGILYGTKTLFVRLAGCPFTCFYCDTTDALPLDSGNEYTIEDACKLIEKELEENTYKVNFTGGDPLIQYEAVAKMAKHIQSLKIPTYLESACFDSKKFNHVLPYIDLMKIEFKTEDSKFTDSKHYPNYIENVLECLKSSISAKKKTYIKIVVSSKTILESFKKLINEIFKTISKDDLSGFIIQPTSGFSEPSLQNLLKFYDVVYPHYHQVRIIPQLQKIIDAP